MRFYPLTLEHLNEIRPFFSLVNSNTCDYSVGGMFMWRDYYKMEFAIERDLFFSRLYNQDNGIYYYNLPLGANIADAIHQNIAYLHARREPCRFCTIPEYYLDSFRDARYDIAVEEQQDYFDYLYDALDLATLKGKKFGGQRNQIHKFMRANSQWRFEAINESNVHEVIEFFRSLFLSNRDLPPSALAENKIVYEVLNKNDVYGMLSGVLYAGRQIVGFSFGEIIKDTLFVHIEKADRAYPGAYQMLVNQFSKTYGGDVRYINREDDNGDLGLRTAKEAYHPICLLKKYCVEVIARTQG